MGIIRNILHILTFGIVENDKQLEERKQREKREQTRRATPCHFEAPLTRAKFEEIAIRVAKRYRRLWVEVDRQYVTGTVRSQSGASEWEFKLDFNDYGKVTGNYWFWYRGNYDSSIPSAYAKELENEIETFLRSNYVSSDDIVDDVVDDVLDDVVDDSDDDVVSYVQTNHTPGDDEGVDDDSEDDDDVVSFIQTNRIPEDDITSFLSKNHVYDDEYFCPNCGAILNNQDGFDPSKGSWTCTQCGKHLMDEDVYDGDKYPGVAWYCDSCGAFLNKQKGFSDTHGTWTCAECGYVNSITEDDIT